MRCLLIGTFLPVCWLLMQVIHETGHVVAALATGGTVSKVVLHPLAISRTDWIGSSHPLLVAWAGPIVGVLAPLALFAVCKIARWKWTYLPQFFAGTCLVANGAYIGAGSLGHVGDAGDLIRYGSPIWPLWLFAAATLPLGLYLWNGLGPSFGLKQAQGAVDRNAAYVSFGLFLLLVAIEVAFSPWQ